jgi:LuxR family maltose regulon positive regulatory protein
MLEQQNAFVVAMDDERSWFRYHQLFGDLLRLELRRTDPGAIPGLHLAASGWFEERGFVVEAVRHAQAAEDWPLAARLLGEHGLSLALDGREATVRALLAAFPPGLTSEPDLALLLAYGELTRGSFDGAAGYVAVAERNAPALSEQRRKRLEIEVAIARLTLARMRGDFDQVLGEAETLSRAVMPEPGSEIVRGSDGRAMALMNLGIVELWAGRIEQAEQHLAQAVELAGRIGRPYIVVMSLCHLAVTALLRSFAEARETAGRAIAVAEEQGWTAVTTLCLAFAARGIADVVQGRFGDAQSWLDRAHQALRPTIEPASGLLVHLGSGMLALATGRPGQALAAFSAAERLQAALVTPHLLTVQALWFEVQTQLALGDVAAAREALAGLSDEERKWGEIQVAAASLDLAEGDPRAVISDVAPVLAGESPVLRDLSVIEALLLRAAAHDRLGDSRVAESDVETALDRAEAESIVFPFITTPVRDLLERHPRHRTAHAGLLSVILDILAGSRSEAPPSRSGELREELSESELRVLRFLPSNLSAPEIAKELYLSTSTVKTHMRHIYAKLEVHHRTEAVEQARRLGLLGPSSRARR